MANYFDDKISYLKGAAIVLVVIGHAGSSPFLNHFIYAFHMALFYFASGLLFKLSYLESPRRFIIRKVKGLYVPFVEFSFLFLILHNFLVLFNFHSGIYDAADYFQGLLKIITFVNVDKMQAHMWFMRSLFVSYIIFYTSLYLLKKKGIITHVIWFCLLMFIGLWMSYKGLSLPIRLERELVCTSLIAIGFYYPKRVFANLSSHYILLVAFLCLLVLLFVVDSTASSINVAISYFVNPLYFTLSTIFGIIFVYCVTIIADRIRGCHFYILSFIGKHTLVIFVFHVLAFRLVNLIKILYYGWDFNKLAEIQIIYENNNALWCLLYTVSGVLLPLFIYYIFCRIKQSVLILLTVIKK